MISDSRQFAGVLEDPLRRFQGFWPAVEQIPVKEDAAGATVQPFPDPFESGQRRQMRVQIAKDQQVINRIVNRVFFATNVDLAHGNPPYV